MGRKPLKGTKQRPRVISVLSIFSLLISLSGDVHPEGLVVTGTATKILSPTNGTSKASLSAGPTSRKVDS
jgi:hypothetical protein